MKRIAFPLSSIVLTLTTSAFAADRVDLHAERQNIVKANPASAGKDAAQLLRGGPNDSFKKIRENKLGARVFQRIQQSYRGVPIWGEQVIFVRDQQDNLVSTHGAQFRGIEKELTDVAPTFPAKDAMAKLKQGRLQAPGGVTLTPRNEKSELVVHMYKRRPRLAWLVSYVADSQQGGHPTRPFAIIDAKTGDVLEQWEGLQSDFDVAGGPGGNAKTGQYEYGNGKPFFMVSIPYEGATTCSMVSMQGKTVNLNHGSTATTAFSFTCPSNTVKSINGAFSPLNDAHFATSVAKNIYDVWLTPQAWPVQLTTRVHYGTNHENAYWLDASITLGDGGSSLYPLVSPDIVSHEAAHGFTEYHSALVYTGQPGSINESFSDMSGEAAEFYINGTNDWLVGAEVTKNSTAVRYMDQPSKDGFSIDHVSQYKGMNVHYSSGVYNRAFYILGHKANWDTRKAWEVFARANMNYWTANMDFYQAACGVIQSATDAGYSASDVTDAFSQVGVTCNADGGPTVPDTALQNGVGVIAPSGATGSSTYYYIDVPVNMASLTMSTSGGTGDVDLYTQFGSKPTTSTYACRPYKNGNNESCTVTAPAAGRYYMMLNAYASYNSVTVKASYSATPPSPPPPPTSETESNNTLGAANVISASGTAVSGSTSSTDIDYYKINVAAGATITLSLTAPYTTFDMALLNASGTQIKSTPFENLSHTNGSAAATYYIRIKYYSGITGGSYTMTATF